MFRHSSHPSLCIFHSREEQQALALDQVGEELTSISGEFRTQTDINHVVGKLFKLVAAGRIPPRRAENLTYIAQLLLQSQKDIKYETELCAANRDYDAWLRTVLPAYPDSRPAASRAAAKQPLAPLLARRYAELAKAKLPSPTQPPSQPQASPSQPSVTPPAAQEPAAPASA
jgi:hypothetical protein